MEVVVALAQRISATHNMLLLQDAFLQLPESSPDDEASLAEYVTTTGQVLTEIQDARRQVRPINF